jgi:hypothetical protein
MKNIGGIKILFIASLVLIILAGTGAPVSLSNSGGGTWKYQREISIKENSGTTLMDYQVLIELKGADFPVEAQSSGADIRFMDFNGNELSYWIESWDNAGKNAKVWVKVPNIPAGSTTIIRIIYGNPNVSSKNNGKITFIEYDENKINGSFLTNLQNSEGFIINANVITTGLESAGPRINFDITGKGNEMTNIDYFNSYLRRYDYNVSGHPDGIINMQLKSYAYTQFSKNIWEIKVKDKKYWFYIDKNLQISTENLPYSYGTIYFGGWYNSGDSGKFNWIFVRKYASIEPTITFAFSITKSASPYSLRQFQESTIKVLIENSGTSEVKAIEIMDSIHPSFDLTGGDFPNPKKFDSIRAGESRELQYTIKSKESGAFTLDPATVTYADSEGNIQEVKSEPVSIKVVPSSEGSPEISSPSEIGSSSAVLLHGEKTDVVLGEDILLKLSAVNLITKPPMSVQVMIYPPSGMSVTGSEFVKSGAGIYTTTYTLNPGDGKDIEVHIKSNQVGDFNVKGRIVYYFGEDKDKAEDHTLNLPIKVRKEAAPQQGQTQAPNSNPSIAGFEAIISISGIFLVSFLRKKW